MVFQCTATVNILPSSICHHKSGWTSSGHILFCTILFKWWYEFELWLDRLKTQTMHICYIKIKQKSHQFVDIAITIHNIYCCNFYLLLSHYFNPTVLIYKVSVTKHQSTASFGIFVFKLPHICNSIHQRHSSCLNIWRARVTSLKKPDGKSDTTEAHTI